MDKFSTNGSAIDAQLEVAAHLEAAGSRLEAALTACGGYLYLSAARYQIEALRRELGRLKRSL